MDSKPVFARLDGDRITVVWMQTGNTLDCVYLGAPLPDGENLAALAQAQMTGQHENMPDIRPVGGLMPDPDTGWRGPTFIELSKDGRTVSPKWDALMMERSGQSLLARWHDTANDIEVQINWRLCAGDMIAASSVVGLATEKFAPRRVASLLLALPRGFDHVTHFAGRWADDMRAQRLPITRAGLSWASRGGKSAFAGGDWLIFDDAMSHTQIGFHMAHNGDHETRIDRNEDGLVTLYCDAPIDDCDAIDRSDQTTTPEALFTWAEDSQSLTQAFHEYARAKAAINFGQTRNPTRTRKVHFNTWEACAFDFDEARVMQLVGEAADLGCERFVLDDGWFKGRSSDRAGLGDWTADAARFPNGLNPLIERVQSLGMDFGLWVEPEMVSPDSDLYRAHPDWCLHGEGADRPTERNQLVLDLSNYEAFDYIQASISKLLREHDIAYLKWDHNRRLFPRIGGDIAEQAGCVEDLLIRLRERHPEVMIESCSSGGGRIDMQLLGLCERFWPSDNNDPIERVRIMESWSRFLPLGLLGNHVGPSPNPITGRRTKMDFRAKIAMFGHMGVEADPGAMTDGERTVLSAHIALYKEWRDALHSGVLHHLNHPSATINAMAVVHGDKALALAAQSGFEPDFNAAPVRLGGLDPDAQYRVTLPQPWPRKAALYLANSAQWQDGITLSGAALTAQGIALPLIHPETAWLIALERVSA